MRRNLKLVSVFIALSLSVAVLSSCSTPKNDDTASTNTSSNTQSAVSEAAGPAPTIKWYQAGDKAKDHNLVLEDINKKIEPKINAKLDLQMIATGEFNDKMKLISTSGEDYDITFTSGWRNNFFDNLARDAFLPLDDLYKQYGQGISAQIPEWLLTSGHGANSTLYAIPNQQIIAYQLGLYVQKEYADKYNLTLTHIDDMHEIEPFLQKLVENEADKIPIDYRSDQTIEGCHEALLNYAAYIKYGDETATILTRQQLEEANPIKNEWYKKGYIRKDIMTVMDTSADIKANRYICSINAYKPGGEAEKSASSGVEWIQIPIGKPYIKSDSGNGTMTAINVNSKNPVESMKMINLIYSDKDIFNELLFGIEGTHYTMSVKNHVEPVADTKYNYGTFAWAFANQFNAWYLPGQKDGTWEATDKLNKEAMVSSLRGFAFDPTPVQAELAQLDAVDKEYLNRRTVADDYKAVCEERAAKDKAAGLDRVLAELQKQIDAWKKAN